MVDRLRGSTRRRARITAASLSGLLTLGLAAIAGPPAGAAATPNPSVDYRFNGTLTDSAGGSTLTVTPACPSPVLNVPNNQCVDTTAFGTDANGPFWTWTAPGRPQSRRGGGFTVQTNTPLTGTYTIALRFSYSIPNLSTYSYLKIIDYKDKRDDTGFYFRLGKLQSYPGNTGPTVYSANEVLDLVATRDASTNEFKVYSREPGGALIPEYTYSDPSGNLVPDTSGSQSLLGFFFDDNWTSSEATTGGNVYRLRTWNGVALTPAEIEAATDASSAPGVAAETPPPWLQSFGRSQQQECPSGWHSSWAEWAVSRTGGWVCNRTVFWDGTSWSQDPEYIWGPFVPGRSSPWDGR